MLLYHEFEEKKYKIKKAVHALNLGYNEYIFSTTGLFKMTHSYAFKSESENVSITIFSVENEDIAWYQLERKLEKDSERYDSDMPELNTFSIEQVC